LDKCLSLTVPSCTRPPVLMHIAATARQVRRRKRFPNWVLIGVKNTCLCHNFPTEAIADTSYESLFSQLLLNRQQQTCRRMTPEMREGNISNVGDIGIVFLRDTQVSVSPYTARVDTDAAHNEEEGEQRLSRIRRKSTGPSLSLR